MTQLGDKGTPGEEIKPDLHPQIDWISSADGSRGPGELEGRAALYTKETNRLTINADFWVFVNIVTRLANEYGDDETSVSQIRKIRNLAIETCLTEVIIGGKALVGSGKVLKAGWRPDDIDSLWSPEALTAVALPCANNIEWMRRRLAMGLGRGATIRVSPTSVKPAKQATTKHSVRVAQSIVHVQTGVVYSSQSEAARKLKLNQFAISKVLRGKKKNVEGQVFQFAAA